VFDPMTLPAPPTRSAAAHEAVLWGRELVKSYGSSPALRGISVELCRGEILAVTGPSGSGKSTLLLCLAGVLRPDRGEVHFAAKRIDGLGETARSALRRSEFGVLFQFGQLVSEMTAAENVALPLLLGGARRRPAQATALQWLARLGVEELADRSVRCVRRGAQHPAPARRHVAQCSGRWR